LTSFGVNVCKTVRPMLSDHCPVCPVCDVGVLWPNGWMDQDETWHGGRHRPLPHYVRWGPISPKKGTAPIFSPSLLWPNGWMDQDVTWYGGRSRLRPYCVTWHPAPPPQKKGVGTAPPPNYRPMSVVAKWLDGSRWHFVGRYISAQATLR